MKPFAGPGRLNTQNRYGFARAGYGSRRTQTSEGEMDTRRIVDGQGTGWTVSEGYVWTPMSQAAPAVFLVFRDGAGRELRADDVPPLAHATDTELRALLRFLRGHAPADAASPGSPASRIFTRSLHPPATAA
jgi:hypothetical protein